MREPGQQRGTTAGRGRTPKQDQRSPWRRAARDSLLAIAGVALVTVTIWAMHLYPRFPSILLTYLLVIIAVASTRGGYAALLTAVLAGISFDFFLTPPSDLINLADLLDPDSWVFLVVAVTTGQVTATLHRHTVQARGR